MEVNVQAEGEASARRATRALTASCLQPPPSYLVPYSYTCFLLTTFNHGNQKKSWLQHVDL